MLNLGVVCLSLPMPAVQRKKPHRVALFLSTEDHTLLKAIVDSEKDTVTNVIRRMIRSKHKRIFSPKPQHLTLRLPQATPDFNLNDKDSK
jgi:hypothetical protein